MSRGAVGQGSIDGTAVRCMAAAPGMGPIRRAGILDFTRSEMFQRTFGDGMELVEETAAYLDGPGRAQSRILPRKVALAYAGESMRLTTRLMQIASWLLIRRAVNEGELTPEQALEEKTKVKLKPEQSGEPADGFDELPNRLKQLIDESLGLNRRIIRLDELLHAERGQVADYAEHPLDSQLARLKAEFGGAGGGEFTDPR
jgi:regulator of CtrA degradation